MAVGKSQRKRQRLYSCVRMLTGFYLREEFVINIKEWDLKKAIKTMMAYPKDKKWVVFGFKSSRKKWVVFGFKSNSSRGWGLWERKNYGKTIRIFENLWPT